MKVLKVIHGYPRRYNAGSEVYSQTLCHALVRRGHEVDVFAREENPFALDYSMREATDPDEARIRLHLVNMARDRDRYRHAAVDEVFEGVLDRVRPDVVHVGHLNHLSTSLVEVAARRRLPILFTLHDYWLMCPRGQFMQTHSAEPWAACSGQEDRRCAQQCYARYFSGDPKRGEDDVDQWTSWVAQRMAHVVSIADRVDLFVAPSRYLLNRFSTDFGIPHSKLQYVDYGFDRSRLAGRVRASGEPFTFGYIGTHIPAKGVNHLVEAFGRLPAGSRLRIWGREGGQNTSSLKALAAALPGGASERITWCGEYRNQDIVREVFNRVDAIVVPSVWVENSPLVIHEAQQAGVPVIAADAGGMAELVEHEVNGLLFAFRDPVDLARKMRTLLEDPPLARALGARGYRFSDDGQVPCVDEHAGVIEGLYKQLVRERRRPGPWRVTFDTNPDDCNLKCVMCEEHSPHSPLQKLRREQGRPPRRMDIALVERLLPELARLGVREVIPSTMGEPLLFKHFERILELCAEHGLKLNLTTNGTFPRLGARRWAELLVPLTSDIKVSWNGATAATQARIMIGSNWGQVVENLRVLAEVRDAHAQVGGNRCRLTLQLTFLETNVGELADIVRFARAEGIDRVKGHHLWAHFHQIEHQSMRRDAGAIRRWNSAVVEARDAAGDEVLLENFFELDPESPGDLAPGGVCPFLGEEAWISAEGRFNPCCAPNEARLTLGEFGNVNDQSFDSIWQGEAYQDLRSTYKSRALCRGCNMRKPEGP
jgi:glycosyltransferase involved in cell wall biosynthesis/MoaA/NifB/PqqE/SkfB family radical SAM enzyme